VGIGYVHGLFGGGFFRVPFVGAFGADEQALVLVDEFGLAAGAWRARHKQQLL
jgi:hypothetical protein